MSEFSKSEIVGISALLVHASKIDENYSNDEKDLILHFIDSISDTSIQNKETLKEAERLEANSNQLLQFTNEIKKKSEEIKSKIIEQICKIMISDNKIDQYESNLLRRICGLIYFPDKLCGEIKLKLLENK